MKIVCREICEFGPCVCEPNTPFCQSETQQSRWFAFEPEYETTVEREVMKCALGPNVVATPTTHDNSLLSVGKGDKGDRDHRARARVDRERSTSGQSNSHREPHINGKSEAPRCPRCGSVLHEWADDKYAGVRCSVCSFVEAGEVG